MKGNDYVTLPEMARKRLGIRCTLTLSWISEWLISVFHMTGKVKIIWLTVCSPLRLWQALLNFLTTSSQLIWREASHPPQVTHTHGHTRTQSHTCTTTSLPLVIGTVIPLSWNASYSMQPLDASPFTRASSPDENDNCLECQLMFGVVIWTYCIHFNGTPLVRKCHMVIKRFDCTVAHQTLSFCFISMLCNGVCLHKGKGRPNFAMTLFVFLLDSTL